MYHIFNYKQKFQLESGRFLPEFQLTYTTLGKLNASKSNVVWITHALTANSNPEEWWSGLVGEDKIFNPEKYFIICANVLGSPYGSTNPLSINPDTGNKYYHNFPEITIRDIVKALDLLRQYLRIEKIHTLLGGSLGGQQAVEWAIQQPEFIQNLFLIATNAQHSPWGIAFNESQRLAIKADRTWFSYSDDAGLKGMKAARAIALLSYRNYQTYKATQQDEHEKVADFKAVSYQNYQGEKLVNRFNAFSYWYLSKAMDSHNVGRIRGGIEAALARIKANTLVVAIDSDLLFPVCESKILAEGINNCQLSVVNSLYGHDGFLIETQQLATLFKNFYTTQQLKKEIYEYTN
ncbi:MAG: homoserine O-acetyltransferase [Flavobacteriales bacterium]|nr:homoserine O-acetyltransferase [Flavobacteriales bacterium]MCW8913118.1 homoserine O-acetyltransferase [Flavobacteriales bacterium]MCW8937800.1 homoserine O-acetyltransferase [Flavobacteriales bacterium]MCW8939049.1 homoserine O-acetyltransferase [Flavobacteriales bacterium]MCW8967388.1 homoserine O-acetyltransferase [Flavobacteriales bacterium]